MHHDDLYAAISRFCTDAPRRRDIPSQDQLLDEQVMKSEIAVTVRTLSGNEVTLSMNHASTIGEMRSMIQEAFGFPPYQQQIFTACHNFSEERYDTQIHNLGIDDGYVIDVVMAKPRLRYPSDFKNVNVTNRGPSWRLPCYMELVRLLSSRSHNMGGCNSYASFLDVRTGNKVAIRRVSKLFDDIYDGRLLLREAKLLRQLRHDNLNTILDIVPPLDMKFDAIYFVMPLMHADLHRVIYDKRVPYTSDHICYFVYQILNGLSYIHSLKIVHCDLKPSHLLVNNQCDLQISGFHLARSFVRPGGPVDIDGHDDYIVTRWYRPPEVSLLPGRDLSGAIDVWSTGCVLAELLGRKPLFPGKDCLHELKLIVGVLGTPSSDDVSFLEAAPPATKAFLRKIPEAGTVDWPKLYPQASFHALACLDSMLRFDPRKRMTASALMNIRFFEDIFDPTDLPAHEEVELADWSLNGVDLTVSLLRDEWYNICSAAHPEVSLDRPSDELSEDGFL